MKEEEQTAGLKAQGHRMTLLMCVMKYATVQSIARNNTLYVKQYSNVIQLKVYKASKMCQKGF